MYILRRQYPLKRLALITVSAVFVACGSHGNKPVFTGRPQYYVYYYDDIHNLDCAGYMKDTHEIKRLILYYDTLKIIYAAEKSGSLKPRFSSDSIDSNYSSVGMPCNGFFPPGDKKVYLVEKINGDISKMFLDDTASGYSMYFYIDNTVLHNTAAPANLVSKWQHHFNKENKGTIK
jgi:hypothetical protein